MGIQVFPSQDFDLNLFPWFHIKDDTIRIHIQLGLRSYRSITNTQLYQIPNNDPIQWHQRDQNSDGIYYIIIFSTKHSDVCTPFADPTQKQKKSAYRYTCIYIQESGKMKILNRYISKMSQILLFSVCKTVKVALCCTCTCMNQSIRIDRVLGLISPESRKSSGICHFFSTV